MGMWGMRAGNGGSGEVAGNRESGGTSGKEGNEEEGGQEEHRE